MQETDKKRTVSNAKAEKKRYFFLINPPRTYPNATQIFNLTIEIESEFFKKTYHIKRNISTKLKNINKVVPYSSMNILYLNKRHVMEMTILQLIQSWHNPILDRIMVLVFNDFVGAKGELWLIIGLILFLIPKTRKCGICVIVSYTLAFFIGDGVLKELIGRVRPCNVDTSFSLIVKRPSSYSCPSVHSMLAFTSAVAIFMNYRKTGIVALVFAILIGFSRMYFFVHYPSDVLFGAILGSIIGYIVFRLIDKGMYIKEK